MNEKVRSALITCAVLSMFSSAQAATTLSFRLSSTFKDGQKLPLKAAGNNKANANCVGSNLSPRLSWSNVPEGTKSFALVVSDAQAFAGQGFDHLVAYGIPASVNSFAEGELSRPSDKFVGGKGSAGQAAYTGPCPPAGPAHHYNFTLIATDLDPQELPPGLTREELLAKLKGHGKDATALVGLFGHP